MSNETPAAAADPFARLRHDLRAPVNQILGYSEMLEEDALAYGQEALVPDLKKIQSAARTLDRLITERVRSGAASDHPGPAPSSARERGGAAEDAHSDARRDRPPLTGHVLAVDDDVANLEMLAKHLLRQGLTVSTASSGTEALEFVRTNSCDIVLLDVMMPVVDGYDVLRHLKRDPLACHIPVVMISALDELESLVRCIEAGAEDYLPKPFNPVLLRARIAASLEKKSLRDAEQSHLRTIEATRGRLERELSEAANYVRAIIPPPVDSPLRIDWKYEPSSELGGDAFGYQWIDGDHLAIYLLDVCGHGVAASLLSVAAINVIRSGTLPGADFHDPSSVLGALNTAFPMERQNNMYFTAWYGIYHAPTRTLRHASAGHPPALLLTAGTCSRLHSPGLIIGMMPGTVYESAMTTIPEASTLFVFCDGCYEIRAPDGSVRPFEDFESFLQIHGLRADALEALLERAHDGSRPLEDDFSILRIRF